MTYKCVQENYSKLLKCLSDVYTLDTFSRFVLSQYDRLRQIHAELEEKLEVSELQNKQLSSEYRSILSQKEVSFLCTQFSNTECLYRLANHV